MKKSLVSSACAALWAATALLGCGSSPAKPNPPVTDAAGPPAAPAPTATTAPMASADTPPASTAGAAATDPQRDAREKLAGKAIAIIGASEQGMAFKGIMACAELSEADYPLPEGIRDALGSITSRSIDPSQKRTILFAVAKDRAEATKKRCGATPDELGARGSKLKRTDGAAFIIDACKLAVSDLPDGAEPARLDWVATLTADVVRGLFEQNGGPTPSEAKLAALIALVGYDAE